MLLLVFTRAELLIHSELIMKHAKQMTLISVFLSLIFLSGCSHVISKNDEAALKKLSEYTIKDFNLNKDIKYFEINRYRVLSRSNRMGIVHMASYPIMVYSDKKAYAGLNTKEKHLIKSSLPVVANRGYFGAVNNGPTMINSGKIASIANLRYISSDAKTKSIATKREVLALLGNIDTPAELQLALWLYNKKSANSYKKVGDRYVFTTRFSNTTMGDDLGCGLHVYRGVMSAQGTLDNYDLIRFNAYEPSAPLSGCGNAP